jgi:hypothetical protein
MALKSFKDIVQELSMKRDKKLKNLMVPVKGKAGTSRTSRMKDTLRTVGRSPRKPLYLGSANKSTTNSASIGTKMAMTAGTEYPTETFSFKDLLTTPDKYAGYDDQLKYRKTKNRKMGYEETEPTEEELSISARRKLARTAKRRKAQLKLARKRARKRMAKTDVLKKRARRSARDVAATKLAKGKKKKDLSVAMKKSLERRLALPAVQRRIAMMTRRMMPTKRKQEIQRKR